MCMFKVISFLQVMAIDPENPAWSRVRPEHHGGAMRSHLKDSEDEPYPRGPDASPVYCLDCDADSQYDSASPASTDWYISSDSSPRYEICEHKESSFDMKGNTIYLLCALQRII